MKGKGSLADCPECERIHAKKNLPTNCEECEKPALLPSNFEILQIYEFCRDQLIIAPMGGAIGLRMEAVKIGMEFFEIEDQTGCLKKISAFCREYFKKEE